MKTNIDGKEYSEIEIEKIVVDGKELFGAIIYPNDTDRKDNLNITIHAKEKSHSNEES